MRARLPLPKLVLGQPAYVDALRCWFNDVDWRWVMKKQFGKTIIFASLASFFVSGVATSNVVASEESARAKIQRAMKAAPSSISDHATILDVTPGWPVLREGSNGWTCFPGVPLNPGDKHPMCNDEVWMDWLYAIVSGEIFPCGYFDKEADCEDSPPPWTPGTVGTSYMLVGDALVNNGNPFASDPNDGGLWDQEGPHIMMLFPTLEEIAELPRDPNAGGPYVMWDETPLVHVMFPMTDRDR